MKPFFSRLSYSFGNEDWRTEREALKIEPNDRVVCITASGDRPLHLLLDECKEIVAVDLNPIQNFLLSLKIAAMQNLEYDRYLAFLGANSALDRKATFERLMPHLIPHAANYWQKNIEMIDKGVLYQGAVEKMANVMAQIFSFFRKKKIVKLFQFDNLDQQQQFINQEWDTYWWKKAFDIVLHPSFSKLWLSDPGLYEHLGNAIQPGKYAYTRITTSLHSCLAKENQLLSFLFLGKVGQEALPPYLTKDGTQTIRPRLGKISIRDCDVVSFLEKEPENSVDRFSISDVASYLNPENFSQLLSAIYRSARPGARFCMRQFMSCYSIPDQWKNKFQRDSELEKRLEIEDRTIIYRFFVGTVQK